MNLIFMKVKKMAEPKGKSKAKQEAKLEMVDGMLANDIPIEKIIAISGFSKEDILKRRDALTKK